MLKVFVLWSLYHFATLHFCNAEIYSSMVSGHSSAFSLLCWLVVTWSSSDVSLSAFNGSYASAILTLCEYRWVLFSGPIRPFTGFSVLSWSGVTSSGLSEAFSTSFCSTRSFKAFCMGFQAFLAYMNLETLAPDFYPHPLKILSRSETS